MHEPVKPLPLFMFGLILAGFVEYVFMETQSFFYQPYGIGVLCLGCSILYAAFNLIGDRRLHNTVGVLTSTAGILLGATATYVLAVRLYALMQVLPYKPLFS